MLRYSKETSQDSHSLLNTTRNKKYKNKSTAPMANRLVFTLCFSVLSCCHALSGHEEIFKCIKEYESIQQGEQSDNEVECSRLKHDVDCFSKGTTDTNHMLDLGRFHADQMARFANKLNYCSPKIDLTDIQRIIAQTGVKAKYLDIAVDDDEPVQCALDVSRACIKIYDDIFHTGKMCDAFDEYIVCLHAEAKERSCSAKILQHYIALHDIIARQYITEMRVHLPAYVCLREQATNNA